MIYTLIISREEFPSRKVFTEEVRNISQEPTPPVERNVM
jgi:hypothetical protein